MQILGKSSIYVRSQCFENLKKKVKLYNNVRKKLKMGRKEIFLNSSSKL